MNKIKLYLDEACISYYSGSPIISDEVFDRLADQVGYMKVGAKQHANVKKHYNRLFSLQKYYEGDKVKPLEGIKDITRTPKLDGCAISILYIDGQLIQVLQRGDGIEGNDVTDKFKARKDLVPLRTERLGVYQVTGEIVAPNTVPNSRNYASGSVNLKDITEFCTRSISFFAYGVYPTVTETFSKDMQVLSNEGFGTVYDNDIHNVYPCDGLVFRINNNKAFSGMGETAKHPKGAYALKEKQEAVETRIIGVEWNTRRTGKVVPTAVLEPVMIGDKLVGRATLNNKAFIEALDLCIGDTVGVTLAGMIIPQVLYKAQA